MLGRRLDRTDTGHIGTVRTEVGAWNALRAQGVILADLMVAAEEHPELVRKHLGSAVNDRAGKFAALNGAFAKVLSAKEIAAA